MYKIMKKNCIKSDFKEIIFKLVANEQSDKRFLLIHTCHISHCEIKSQNLAHLEASSHKIFQISQNFQTIFQHFMKK